VPQTPAQPEEQVGKINIAPVGSLPLVYEENSPVFFHGADSVTMPPSGDNKDLQWKHRKTLVDNRKSTEFLSADGS